MLFSTQNILMKNHEYRQHVIHYALSPLQDYLTAAWGVKSSFWGVTQKIGTFIKAHPDQQSTHGGWFLYEWVSFHWLAETFSHKTKLKQLFESINLHFSEWYMHTRNLNPDIFSVSTVHVPRNMEIISKKLVTLPIFAKLGQNPASFFQHESLPTSLLQ